MGYRAALAREYLDATVFHDSRPCTRQGFKAFMRSRSHPFPRTIAAAQELAKAKRYQLMTTNDESAELNVQLVTDLAALGVAIAGQGDR